MLERLKIEQVIDVFQAIKAMRIPRPGLVKTAVSQHLENRNSRHRFPCILLIPVQRNWQYINTPCRNDSVFFFRRNTNLSTMPSKIICQPSMTTRTLSHELQSSSEENRLKNDKRERPWSLLLKRESAMTINCYNNYIKISRTKIVFRVTH